MRAQAIQVTTATAEKKDAETLAQAVLDKRLGACVQISGPIESRYWWNGRIETASEWTLTIKTRHDLFKQLEKLLLELHTYDQPEIIATAVAEVSAGYLKWLTEQVGGEDAEVGDQKPEVGGQRDKGTRGRGDRAKE
ncbi:MAG: divalent-cation tolerance protein CutA [Planctomycetia bacterium]|nr:divalent-cation tolerance protein CutA [Planctomycetia bacterium]